MDKAQQLVEAREQMDRFADYDCKDFDNMHQTSFIQHLINIGWPVKAVPVEKGWLEIATVEDLEYYQKMFESGKNANLFNV